MKSVLVLLALSQLSTALFASPLPNTVNTELSPPNLKALASQKQWLRLMHYEKTLWGGYRSQVTDPKFFFSPEGRENPEKELAATAKALVGESGTGDEHPQCVFPARYRWLKAQLHLEDFRNPPRFCPKHVRFRELVDAHSATVIFSSYYLNNPSSAFGHTMLRLNKSDAAVPGKRFELLDFGVNYAAEVTTGNPFVYAFNGIFGLFRGVFTRVPYYYKVREYNDFESRDLWEYDLNLTPDQLAMLVDHIWELGSTHFDYYYLTQNCSYHLMTALEVAIPDVDLVDDLPYVVIPADTIRVLVKTPGLVTKVNYRPSLLAQFRHRLEPLSSEEIKAVANLASNENLNAIPQSFTPEQKAQVLDAAMDHFDLRNFKTLLGNPEDPIGAWKEKMLVARSQLRVMSDDIQIDAPENGRPDLGHDITRVSLDSGYSTRGEAFSSVSFRLALHDLLDPTPGYPQNAQIEFFNTRLRYNLSERSLWLEHFNFFQVTSLTPIDTFTQRFSWKARLGAATVRDDSCDHCTAVGFEVGGGLTYQPWNKIPLFGYLMSDIAADFTPKFYRSFMKLGVGPTLGIRWVIARNWIALVEGGYKYQFLAPSPNYLSYLGELRWSLTPDLALNLKSQGLPDSWENSLGLYYYF